MVDWVFVELVKGVPGEASFTRAGGVAAFLHDTGFIVNHDDENELVLEGLQPGNYHLIVHHRNHLAVISKEPIPFIWGRRAIIDFTGIAERAYSSGGPPLNRLGPGQYGLWSGEGDQNGSVSAFDFLNVWLPSNGGSNGYHLADFKMDGSVTSFDFLEGWLPSNGQVRQY